MSDGQHDFASLMRRVQEGSPEAAREVCELYGPHIVRVIRRRLSRRLRSEFDSIDFTQAVWASFFALEPERQHFAGPRELMAFLAMVARNKVIEAYRHRVQSQRYGTRREYPLARSAEDDEQTEPPGRQPTPSQFAVAQEQWDRLQAGLPPPYRCILEMLRQGHTHGEIARALGLTEKTVQRVIRLLAARVA
ncbi:MAG TPA: sigma-70 family RNA polymerase sigma factor [Gemmataceae bacterium]|nr:sigma-70 family RNA polymerase sigma factor [Gemmataceae bacterium]